ncbi:MAG: TetR/AcrR family transcriptional regulator [Desulfobacterales bacterium]|nr:TetR/AcrR family transcriptional regulator [Desulfobacterales bacterium]
MITRREKLRQDTIREIKTIAWDMLKQNRPVTIHEITRQMGMTAPAFYTYFKNRDALMTGLVKDSLDSFHNALTAPFNTQEARDTGLKIKTTFTRYRAWAIDNPNAFSLFAGREVEGFGSGDITILASRGYRVFFDLFKEADRAGMVSLSSGLNFSSDYETQLEGIKKELDTDLDIALIHQVIHIVSLVHGLISLELSGRFNTMVTDGKILFEAQLESVLSGFGG